MTGSKIDTGAVFERREKKYRMTRAQYHLLMERLDDFMCRDRYGEHTILSVYYDTDDFRLIRHSLDKPAFKEKLRLRGYGVPGMDDDVYLELKKKLGGVTYKRRMALPLRCAEGYLNRGERPAVDSQVFGEIDWFVHKLTLRPRVLLAYDRIALFGREDPTLRITVDRDIRWRAHDLSLSLGDHGAPVLPQGGRLMEIKTLGALPLWLSSLISELCIYPAPFSKYGVVYSGCLAGEPAVSHGADFCGVQTPAGNLMERGEIRHAG